VATVIRIAIDSPRFWRLGKEFAWIVLGNIVALLGTVLGVRVLTEYLEPVSYGHLALGLTIATLVNQVVMGGMNSGISRYYAIAAEKGDVRSYLHASLGLMLYATLAVLVLGLLILLGEFELRGYSQWMGLTIASLVFAILSGYNSTLSGIQNAARQRKVVAFHVGLDAWLKIALALGVLFWLGQSGTSVVIGYTLSLVIVSGSQLVFLQGLVPKQVTAQQEAAPWASHIWAYSWPMITGGLFNWGYYASQRWALELFATTSQVGQFYALTQIAYTPISIAGALFLSFLTPILFSRVGDASDRERIESVRRIVVRIAGIGLAATMVLAIISYFVHDLIFRFAVATEYRGVSIYMPYVVLAAGILQVSVATSTSVMVANRTIKFLPLSVFGNGAVILMNFYLTSKWGIDGLICSMVAGATLHLTWMLLIAFPGASWISRSKVPLRN
jgi:O-antigen/teichoic acid export membrane protein